MHTWETLPMYLVTECNQRDPLDLVENSVQELRPRTLAQTAQDGLRDFMQCIKHPEIRQDISHHSRRKPLLRPIDVAFL